MMNASSYNELDEPLISKVGGNNLGNERENSVNEDNYRSTKLYCVSIGFLVGVIIQILTLFVNVFILYYAEYKYTGADAADLPTTHILLFSTVWSAFIATVAVLMLKLIRKQIQSSAFAMHQQRSTTSDSGSCKTISFLDAEANEQSKNLDPINGKEKELLLLNFETHIVAGVLMGVCVSWSILTAILGLQLLVVYSLIGLLLASAWGYVFLSCFEISDQSDILENDALIETSTWFQLHFEVTV